MLLFLATILEQLDLALEHILKRDVHNARFGLMLTDNALELVLHQIAKDTANDRSFYAWRQEVYPHQAALDRALGRSFGDKLNFVRLTALMTEQTAATVGIMHGFRNEVYHAGLQHETTLPALSSFYFDVTCEYLGRYEPRSLSWSSNQPLPDRAQKYFKGHLEDFARGCAALAQACGHNPAETIAALADHFDVVVEEQDADIDIIAEGVYANQRTTRDKAVVACQTWRLALSEEGRAFGGKRAFTGNMREFNEWLATHYNLRYRRDPIPRWKERAAKLRTEKSAHAALKGYHTFMTETVSVREALSDLAAACAAEIDAGIERARGN